MKLSDLMSAKKVARENKGNKEQEYDSIMEEAVELFSIFLYSNKEKDLKNSADLFYKALECTRKYAEPYFFLANIFYITKNTDKARIYLKTVEALDPSFAGIKSLKPLLYK
jgi:tetratricopeptide (TPR) repeat protein